MIIKKFLFAISFLFLSESFLTSCSKEGFDEDNYEQILLESDINATEKGSTISIGGSSDSGDDDYN